MIDLIRLTFFTKYPEHFKPICKFSRKNSVTGEKEYFNYDYNGFYVAFSGDNCVTIQGSLHKLRFGSNYCQFKRTDIEVAVQKLCKLFLIDPTDRKVNFITLEAGVNVPTDEIPMEYVDAMMFYCKNLFIYNRPKKRTTELWGKSCYSCDFTIKFYDKYKQTIKTAKDPLHKKELEATVYRNTLRYEVVYYRPKKLPYLYSLSSLYSVNFLEAIAKDLLRRYQRVKKIPVLDFMKMGTTELRRYFSATVPMYWKYLRRVSKSTYKKEKKEYDKLVSTYAFPGGDITDELEEKVAYIARILITT